MKERIGCLITEIVVPGWNPDQHVFIDGEKVNPSRSALRRIELIGVQLKDMWGGQEGWEIYEKYLRSAP